MAIETGRVVTLNKRFPLFPPGSLESSDDEGDYSFVGRDLLLDELVIPFETQIHFAPNRLSRDAFDPFSRSGYQVDRRDFTPQRAEKYASFPGMISDKAALLLLLASERSFVIPQELRSMLSGLRFIVFSLNGLAYVSAVEGRLLSAGKLSFAHYHPIDTPHLRPTISVQEEPHFHIPSTKKEQEQTEGEFRFFKR